MDRAEFDRINDPLEPLNRKTFEFNQFLDHTVFRPAAKAYMAIVPDDGRAAVHHMLDNMKEPTLAFNNLLQGEFERAGISVGRFLVNSTVGFGGVVDVMALSGVERQPADFGQTLFVWGAPSGPYLVLPFVGPTNPRDAIGSAVDSYDDPFTILANDHGVTELTTSRFIVGGVEARANVMDVLDDLEKNSVDFYAQMRSLWQQHREAELRHGKAPNAVPGLYDDPGVPVPPVTPAPKPAAANDPAGRVAGLAPSTRVAVPPVAAPAEAPVKPASPRARGARSAPTARNPVHHKQAAPKQGRPGAVTPCAAPRCAGRAT